MDTDKEKDVWPFFIMNKVILTQEVLSLHILMIMVILHSQMLQVNKTIDILINCTTAKQLAIKLRIAKLWV